MPYRSMPCEILTQALVWELLEMSQQLRDAEDIAPGTSALQPRESEP